MPSLAALVFRTVVLACTYPLATPLAAQCGTMPPAHPFTVAPTQHPGPERGGGPAYAIPTVVHIHYGGGLLPMGALHVRPLLDQCNADLRAMNDDLGEVIPEFADVIGDLGVELRLATRDATGACMSGIRYHLFDPQGIPPQTATYNQDTRRYLNIHILSAITSSATFPSPVASPYNVNDVIILSTDHAANRPRVLAHEVGHWLGLFHTWGQTNTPAVTCGDDGIADTPITAGSPSGSCDLDRNTCTVEVVENVQNHMDYAACPRMFTAEQSQRVLAVLADPALVRAQVVGPANLLGTGVTEPPPCAITAGMHLRVFEHCTGTTVRLRALAEHSVADSVRWTFAGGAPNTSADDHPSVVYTTSGTYAVNLVVYGGGGSASASTTVDVHVPDATANGLEVTDVFLWTANFENGFALPDAHVAARQSNTPTWQRYDQAGYASTHSLYVPAEVTAVADTNDLLLGNFDMGDLQQATVQLKVSSSNHALAGGCSLQLRFIDLCSNAFSGEPWAIWSLDDMAADHGQNFVPSSDDQWRTLSVTQDGWNLASSGEFVLRLIRAPMLDGSIPEGIWIDDIHIGEPPLATGLDEARQARTLRIAPNPFNGSTNLRLDHDPAGPVTVEVFDVLGKEALSTAIHPKGDRTMHLPMEALLPGAYLVRVSMGAQIVTIRLVKTDQ